MRVGVLVTDNGAHPPEMWAEETASQLTDIIQIEDSSPIYEAAIHEKNQFRKDLVAALTDHHDDVQKTEKSNLAVKGANHNPTPETYVSKALETVTKVAEKTMFGPHFRKPEVRQFVSSTLLSHFHSVADIEKSWHLDNLAQKDN